MTHRTLTAAAAVIERFLDWATDPRLVILDTETTGFDGEVIELGLVDGSGRTLFDERFRPTCPIDPRAQAVHGIKDADLAGCPRFGERWPEIRDLLTGRRVVIYNKRFDLPRICATLDATRPGWFEAPGGAAGGSADLKAFNTISRAAECVMDAYSPLAGSWNDYYGSYRWAKLADASAQRGVDVSDLTKHAAVSDCVQVLRLIRACAALSPADFPWIGHEDRL
ncbi:3'-5' exonuclease [Deinococcus sp. 6YEL10]|uniref:3'-5' exonuclease n=1 Tax=Deinococcus sp. 6YEL10 TaxID=2745870 RepID=UPI001E52D0FB|nr:3'-5' exonuclease [Deinococcus sp. 6YEL10]MCD0160266.1 3'-5' exonuclease [Deinococcus sp. 6YEL10]